MEGKDAYYALAERLRDELACDRTSLFLVDHDKGEVWSKAAIGLEIPEIRLPMHRGVVGFVARTGRPLNLKDVYNDPRFDRTTDRKTGYRTKTMLTMAVRGADGAVLGVLQALNKRDGDFTTADEAAMARYCDEAAQAIVAGR